MRFKMDTIMKSKGKEKGISRGTTGLCVWRQ